MLQLYGKLDIDSSLELSRCNLGCSNLIWLTSISGQRVTIADDLHAYARFGPCLPVITVLLISGSEGTRLMNL
jgi:hypothetical protein